MNKAPEILIVAEVGKRVGWGHVARSCLLRNILSPYFSVTIKVINREVWNDDVLERKYAFNEPVSADIVFFDGLSLRSETANKIKSQSKVSISYISDINTEVDCVVAPALNGMSTPSNYITDLSAILCNQPTFATSTQKKISAYDQITVGVCMGGSDIDGITLKLEEALKTAGFKTKQSLQKNDRRITLIEFLRSKLEDLNSGTFPHYDMTNCDMVVCQGGLSAVEFSLLGVPTVIRRRPDFPDAYHFLEELGFSFPSTTDDIPSLVRTVSFLASNKKLLLGMADARTFLHNQIQTDFWIKLINGMTEWRTQ